MKSRNFRNIIFDLGGVILNINPQLTVKRLAALCQLPPKEVLKRLIAEEFVYDYEKGLIPCSEFRAGLRRILCLEAGDELLDEAWNELLLDIPHERIELLQNLRKEYTLVLLSNTNKIHQARFLQTLEQTTGERAFEAYFHAVYYSHEMKKRKPDPAIYEQVLKEQQLEAHQTLFIDDNRSNLEGAQSLGIQTLHIADENTLKTFFGSHYPLS